MATVLTRNTELKEHCAEKTQANTAAKPVLLSSFQYYIHDSVTTLRFQLRGDLRASDVTELNGSWETAQTTLARRRLVLDLCQLASADEHGRGWLLKMKDTGAAFLPADSLETNARPLPTAAQADTVALSFVGRMLAIVKPKP
jgi:hypothetical protein